MKLTNGEKFIYEWQHGVLGGFKTALINAIAKADTGNLERLRLGFPDEVHAYIQYSTVNGWWQDLEERARK